MAAGDTQLSSRWLRIHRLTGSPGAGLDCCWVLSDSPAASASNAVPTLLRMLAVHDMADEPFVAVAVAVAVADGDAVVRRVDVKNLTVRFKRSTPSIKIHHCLTLEGMRVEVQRRSSRRVFYVPLSTEVEVDQKHRCAPSQRLYAAQVVSSGP